MSWNCLCSYLQPKKSFCDHWQTDRSGIFPHIFPNLRLQKTNYCVGRIHQMCPTSFNAAPLKNMWIMKQRSGRNISEDWNISQDFWHSWVYPAVKILYSCIHSLLLKVTTWPSTFDPFDGTQTCNRTSTIISQGKKYISLDVFSVFIKTNNWFQVSWFETPTFVHSSDDCPCSSWKQEICNSIMLQYKHVLWNQAEDLTDFSKEQKKKRNHNQ